MPKKRKSHSTIGALVLLCSTGVELSIPHGPYNIRWQMIPIRNNGDRVPSHKYRMDDTSSLYDFKIKLELNSDLNLAVLCGHHAA